MKNNPELNFDENNNPRYSAKAIASFFADKSNLSPYDFIKLDFEHDIFNNAKSLYNDAIKATEAIITANDVRNQQDKLNSLQREEDRTVTRENGQEKE